MRSTIYANSVQMNMMAKVIDDHCREHGIAPDGLKRTNLARVVMSLFEHGACSKEELRAILATTRTLSLQPRHQTSHITSPTTTAATAAPIQKPRLPSR